MPLGEVKQPLSLLASTSACAGWSTSLAWSQSIQTVDQSGGTWGRLQRRDIKLFLRAERGIACCSATACTGFARLLAEGCSVGRARGATSEGDQLPGDDRKDSQVLRVLYQI